MHEEPFTRLQLAAVEDIAPDREKGFWQRGCFDIGEPAGNGKREQFMRYGVLRIAAAGQQGGDAIADGMARDACSQRLDRARDLEARKIRRALGCGILALTLQDIRPVDARRRHPDEDFLLGRRGQGPCLRLQHVRPAKTVQCDRDHRIRQCHSTSSSFFVSHNPPIFHRGIWSSKMSQEMIAVRA